MELMKGVHRIATYANCALLVDDRVVLVDTGKEAAAQAVLDYLPKARLQPRDIASVIITHCHPDHAGGLAAVKARAPAARVAAHAEDAAAVESGAYAGPPVGGRRMWTGVKVDDRLRDGQRHEGLRVIHVPGHTPGSIALLDEDRSLLLAGDAFNTDPGSGPILHAGLGTMDDAYNVDPKQHRESIRKLARFEFEAAIVGHDPAVLQGAGAKLKELAERL